MSEYARSFDVVVPANHGAVEESVLALRAYAAAHRLDIFEKPTEEFITARRLGEISMERWGTVAYGRFAGDMLFNLQELSTGGVVLDRMFSAVSVVLQKWGLEPSTGRIGSSGMSEQQIYGAAHALLDSVVAPFPFTIQQGNLEASGWLNILPCAPTAPRLARYLQSKAASGQRLHGKIGKSLDVLCLASGLEPVAKAADREWSGAYLADAALRTKMRQAGFSPNQTAHLFKKINAALADQWDRGAPNPYGEIIVDYNNPDPVPETHEGWQKIAARSLASLADGYDRESAVVDFLENTAREFDN